MGHDYTDLPVSEIIALLAADAVALVVDAHAVGVPAANAVAFYAEIEGIKVAGHAVEVLVIPKNASVPSLGRSDDRVLRKCAGYQ